MTKTDWILLIIANLTVGLFCIFDFIPQGTVPIALTFLVLIDIVYLLLVKANDGA